MSREPGQPKKYVQALIDETASDIAEAIIEKKGFLYICGDAKNMAHDVENRLRKIFGEHKGGTAEKEGAAELKLLKDRNRLLLVRCFLLCLQPAGADVGFDAQDVWS